MPVILATQEAEIRRFAVPSQPGQIVHEILSRKTLHTHRHKKVGLVEWLKEKGPEFKSQYHKKMDSVLGC
jgi:hypothetical protein